MSLKFGAWRAGLAVAPSPAQPHPFEGLLDPNQAPNKNSSWSQLSQNGIPIVLMMFLYEARTHPRSRPVEEHHQHKWGPHFQSTGTRRGPKPRKKTSKTTLNRVLISVQADHVLAHKCRLFAKEQPHFTYWTSLQEPQKVLEIWAKHTKNP